MTDITGEFRRPFAEQIAAFRLRLGDLVPTAKWDDISHAQHDRAFMVAGAMKADLLADLAAAVDKAVSQGTSLQEFRRDFRQIVETRGWHGWTGEETKRGQAWRTRVIYKTNMATSYAAGRMAQLVGGGFSLWVYRHGASLEPRLQHLGWDGLILPPDHPFWLQHAPPNGWGCSCYVLGARSEAGAVRLGGKPGMVLPDGWDAINPKTGAQVGIDKGWGYAPGASVVDDIIAAMKAKQANLPVQLEDALDIEIAAQRSVAEERGMFALLKSVGADASDIMAIARGLDEPRLSVAEKAAINFYTREDTYKALNKNLREIAKGRGSMSSPLFLLARVIDRAIAKLPKYEGTVTRGIRRLQSDLRLRLMELENGDTVAFRGYSSSSLSEGSAFPGTVRFRIRSISARRIQHLSSLPGEQEALFGRGLQFRVTGRTFEGKVLVIDLDELPPGEWTKTVKELMFETCLE